jgi:outer membrane protein W
MPPRPFDVGTAMAARSARARLRATKKGVHHIMLKRLLVLFSVCLFPLFAFAQSNEIGVFISTSQFDDSEINDAGDIFDLKFDEDMGYGVSYNRYWTPAFSTEFAYQKLGADLTVSFQDIAADAGDLDLDVLSATGQFHFLRGSMFSPYVGGGVAYTSGQSGSIDTAELEDVDLENELDWLVNAGVDIGLGRSMAIFVDGKYIAYEARAQGDSNDDAVDINPLILSAGLKFRF